MMNISPPYLLFIGDAVDPLSIKMARSAADWCGEHCVGEFTLPGCQVSTGLRNMSIAEAAKLGAKTFVLGFANSGGTLAPEWIPSILEALDGGLHIVSGLHDKLCDIEPIATKAKLLNRQLIDLRHPQDKFRTGTGAKRSGKRVLTVGTDCSVGKMYTSLSIKREMDKRGLPSTFRATGQCGILISGAGIAIDCVVADFISGAVESLSPANSNDHWDIIEGQGSLFHPAFAGVSLGLLHGAQADALVVCHAFGREHIRGLTQYALPSLEQCIELNERTARLTNKNAKVVGISVNSSCLHEQDALQACDELSERLDLPVIDPFRHDMSTLMDNFL
jgi:uncharacterized NAD-dependent epimerase/dehydratase family protein